MKRVPVQVIGEPSGGSYQHFGEIKRISLPGSGATFIYSTKYHSLSDTKRGSIIPDILIKYTIDDYAESRDPVLAHIRNL